MNMLCSSWPVYTGVGVILVIGLACLIFKIKKHIEVNKTGIDEYKDVRYTADEEISKDGDANISYTREDILIAQHQEEIVGKDNKVKPGKYTILFTATGEDKMNIRIGTYVREFSHGAEVILADGDKVCPVSGNIILR